MKKPIGVYNNQNMYLTISSYRNNGRLGLLLDTEEENYCDITINLSDYPIQDDNVIFLQSYISDELEKFLVDNNVINEPDLSVPYNMGMYKCSTVDFDKIKEYDPEGYKEFEKIKNN